MNTQPMMRDALESCEDLSENHIFIENMPEGYAYCQMLYENEKPTDWIFFKVNNAFEKHTGLKNVIGKQVTKIIPEIREADPAIFNFFNRVIDTGNPDKFEMKIKSLKKWFSVSVYRIHHDYFVALFDDITERKHFENELILALDEKKLLLKEIHHRVKNNLQIVTSLLNIQSEYVTDQLSKEYFRVSADRVRAIALIHQQLYSSINLSQINFELYLKDLVNHLFKLYCFNPEKIKINIHASEITMDMDNAMTCGLLVNEIITNSLKHAFPGKRKGEIKIDLKKRNGEYFLNIYDNGVGMPEIDDVKEKKSLGMELIKMLSEQLDASIEVKNEKGTEYNIKFKSPAC